MKKCEGLGEEKKKELIEITLESREPLWPSEWDSGFEVLCSTVLNF